MKSTKRDSIETNEKICRHPKQDSRALDNEQFITMPSVTACRRRHETRPARKKPGWRLRTTNWRSRLSH